MDEPIFVIPLWADLLAVGLGGIQGALFASGFRGERRLDLLGVAIIGTLLAETKMSNQGLGFLIIQTYTTFNMPRMYALLITLFLLAIGLNALIAWFSGGGAARKS
ncbi:MAG: hypothetical protein ACT60Q_18245 [Ferrovibrionaceae bacterium]